MMKHLFLILIIATSSLQCEDKTDWYPKPPELISLSATSGKEGETLVITGKHFSTTPTDNVVLFNDVAVTVTEATKTTLTITVPAGEGQVMVRVVTKSLVAKKKLSFTYIEEIAVPIDPEEPGTIEDPVNPGNPDDPQNPGDPLNPNDPQNPVDPQNPNDPQNPVNPEPLPVVVVTSMAPLTGVEGMTATIVGQNFSTTPDQNLVRFGNTSATVISATATSLTVKVPAGTNNTSVAVSVTVNNNVAVKKPQFAYRLPIVTSISPSTAPAGAYVYIDGSYFSATLDENQVLFGNVTATVVQASPTRLKVKVPPGDGSVSIFVSVTGNLAATQPQFTYAAPNVFHISPTRGSNEETIYIIGENFSATLEENVVFINGIQTPVIAGTLITLTVKAPAIPFDFDHACDLEATVSVTVNNHQIANQPTFTYENQSLATTVAFAGKPYNPGDDDGLGTAAKFYVPLNLTNDDNGNLYLDSYLGGSNFNIRKIAPDGNVTTITNGKYPDVDNQGNLYFTRGDELFKRTPSGTETLIATIPEINLRALTVDNSGNVYIIPNLLNQPTTYIRKITPSGVLSIFAGSTTAGNADGQGTNAQFSSLDDLEYDEANNILYALQSDVLRKITMTANVTTIPVNLNSSLKAIAIDPSGQVYLNTSQYGSCKLQPNGDCCGVIDTENYMNVNSAGELTFIKYSAHALYKVSFP